MTSMTSTERDAAARAFLDDEDAESASWDECRYESGYESGPREWLILTDEEATERATESIRDSAWAFNTSFLIRYVPDGVTHEVLAMIGEKCENGNPSMLALIGDRFEEFASDAIDADGRGHFLSSWDGAEHEFEHGGRLWFAYRN